MNSTVRTYLIISVVIFVSSLIGSALYNNRPESYIKFQRKQGYVWNAKLWGEISVVVETPDELTGAKVLIDNEEIGTLNSNSDRVTINTADYPLGWHTIHVILSSNNNESSIEFSRCIQFIPVTECLFHFAMLAMIVIAFMLPIIGISIIS